MTREDQKFILFSNIVVGMLANCNGGDAVWANPQSQANIIQMAKNMSEIAFPAELPEAVATPAPVDAEATEVTADTSQAA